MKRTKLPKKLALNKNTVTNLDLLQQNVIKGGYTALTYCGTCENTCTNCPTLINCPPPIASAIKIACP